MGVLVEGKTYKQKELAAALGIKDGTFRNNKAKYIEELNRTYEYVESRKGQCILYTIIKQRDPNEDFSKKIKSRKKKDEVLKPALKEVLIDTPWQSGSSAGRMICEKESVKNLGYAESTIEKEVRRLLKEMCGTKVGEGGPEGRIERLVFCGIDVEKKVNIPLNGELKKEYNKLIELYSENYKEDLLMIRGIKEDCQQLGIQIDDKLAEKSKEINSTIVVAAKRSFKDAYQLWPMWLPEYLLYAWPDESKRRDVGDADIIEINAPLKVKEGEFEWPES